jgi:hypothetical protein
MLRLALKLLLAGAALAAVWAFVPFGGATLADRWAAAPDAGAFVDRTWADMKGEPEPPPARPRPPARAAPAQGQARTTAPAKPPRRQPTEGHTDADRRALDRILADRVRE